MVSDAAVGVSFLFFEAVMYRLESGAELNVQAPNNAGMPRLEKN
jgi:hypothetical protein